MGELIGIRHVLHGDIVGNNELFQSGAEGFAKGGIGFDPKGLGSGPDPAVCLELALRSDHRRADGVAGLKFFQVLGDLAVQEPDPVLAGESQEGAGAGQPGASGCFDLLK